MKKNLNKIAAVFFSWFVLIFGISINSNTYANNASDPVSLLKYIADNMIAGLKSNQATLKTKPQVVYGLAYKYVVPYADLGEMAKRVLPPTTWMNASNAQRKQFEKQFTTLVIRTYASALTSYRNQTVQFYPVRGGTNGNNVEVNSEIMSPSSDSIHVTYRLLRIGSAWRLYDMSVEGVSLIDSFRSQFAGILSTGNMDQLLHQLSSHNTRAS